MRILLLVLVFVSSLAWGNGVWEDHTMNQRGEPLIRFHNNTSYPVSCYYRDQVNFFTFIIQPMGITPWLFQYGRYQWECNF